MRILVLGGGPGGYSCAFEAARLGAQVTLVEREALGGTCLNWGCIPTKTILRSARIAHDAANAAEFGLRLDRAGVDIERLMERKEGVLTELRSQIEANAG
jgi:dihydrolipoamide dehydrogenase